MSLRYFVRLGRYNRMTKSISTPKSSCLSSLSYDKADDRLEATFRSNRSRVYTYRSAPALDGTTKRPACSTAFQRVLKTLIEGRSIGREWNLVVRRNPMVVLVDE